MSTPYSNRTVIAPFTKADAADVNNETAKIQLALCNLQASIDAIVAGTPLAQYTWIAYADSADGSSNFIVGDAGTRKFIGLAYGQSSPTESTDPALYSWTQFRGDDGTPGTNGGTPVDGTSGEDGDYRDIRFIRQYAPPTVPADVTATGWTDDIPDGVETLWAIVATISGANGALLTSWSLTRLSNLDNRGIYIATETYYFGNVVTKGGGSYILTVDQSTGNAPTGTGEANAYWDVIAAPGNEGDPATPPSAFAATIILTTTSSGLNLRTLADDNGYTGKSDATITFEVPSGVTVQGLTNGGISVDSGNWPTTDYTISLNIVVQSGGKVYGGGGNGGNAGFGSSGSAGSSGGDGIYCRTDIDVTVDAGGEIISGGGGGGGGSGSTTGGFEPDFFAGSGGGGGYPNGAGGSGYGVSNDGAAGTISGGGAGGAATPGGFAGANGGNAATAGGAGSPSALGGAAGFAVRISGFAVTITNNGTITGATA